MSDIVDSKPDQAEVEPLSERSPNERSPLWRILQVFARIMCAMMFDLKTYGKENVPAEGGVLLVANHQSYLDPVLLAVHLRRPMSYLAKSELFKNPAFSWLIRSLNAFPVRLGRGDKGAIEETVRRLKMGYLLNVFPEGTRTEDGEIAPLQRGVALVIRRAPVPIVPVVIDGSFQAWPKDRKVFHPHPIRVMYGPPLQVDGMKADQIIELMESTLQKMFHELRLRSASESPFL